MVKLGKKWLTKRPDELRYEARMVLLDGKLARARALNALADKMQRRATLEAFAAAATFVDRGA